MERFVYPSTYLRSQDFEQGRILYESWYPNARYAWDAGVAIGGYLQGLKAGKLLARHCPECGRVLIPPRMFCESCFAPTDRWVELEDSGTVITFSICYVTWDMLRLREPQIPAVIGIDGASRGVGIMHLLGEVDPQAVHIGMRVRAVWKPAAERIGAITDIAYFKPV